jgi:transposase-like protein
MHVEGKAMTQKRRQYSAAQKFKVALAAAKGDKTISQLASETGIHPTQIGNWKRQLLEDGAHLFESNGSRSAKTEAVADAELYEQIGRLKMELEWLKKKVAPFV